MTKALTAKALEHIKPGTARREIPDGHTSGLYLIVQPSGVMSWCVRYRAAGIPKKYTIGRYPGIDLVNARKLASAALVKVAERKDPALEKKADRLIAAAGADTVAAIADEFIERYAKKKTRESTWKETERIFELDVKPLWGTRRIGEIEKRDVVRLLDRVSDRGATTMVNRTLATVRKFFNWAANDRGLRTTSPCAGIKAPSPERSRTRVLSDEEIALIWKAAQGEGEPFGPFIQSLLLVGQRRDEVAGITRAEIDFDEKTWTLARDRTKNDTAHVVPLSDAAISLLQNLKTKKNSKGLLFSTTGSTPISGFSRSKERLDASIARIQIEQAKHGEKPKPLEPWVLHDLRRTVSTGLARLGVRQEVTEAILNHKSGKVSGVARVYNRFDYAAEKRAALDDWARHVEAIVNGAPESNVVPIASARRA